MRHLLISLVILVASLLCASPTWARLSMKLIRWLETGELEIPREVQQAQNPADLQGPLKSKDTFIRAAAVRRLGELGEMQAVPQLLVVHAN